VAQRQLVLLHAPTELATLHARPGNQLEAQKGDRDGQHSIRVNDQWRMCFRWDAESAQDIEIVDYY